MRVVVVGVVWWLNCYEGGCCGGCLVVKLLWGWLLWGLVVVLCLLWGMSRSGSCCGGCLVAVVGGVLVSTPGLPFTSLFLPKFLPCMSNHYLLTLVQRQ